MTILMHGKTFVWQFFRKSIFCNSAWHSTINFQNKSYKWDSFVTAWHNFHQFSQYIGIMEEIESVMGSNDEWATFGPMYNYERLGKPCLSKSHIDPCVAHLSLGSITDSLLYDWMCDYPKWIFREWPSEHKFTNFLSYHSSNRIMPVWKLDLLMDFVK